MGEQSIERIHIERRLGKPPFGRIGIYRGRTCSENRFFRPYFAAAGGGRFLRRPSVRAYKFVSDLIRTTKESILLIDNYVDESVLMMLGKRGKGVSATICTQRLSRQLQLDLAKYDTQYPPIELRVCKNIHDRFLIIDNAEVYHIGASLKDLGKKMFAFSKLGIPAESLTSCLSDSK